MVIGKYCNKARGPEAAFLDPDVFGSLGVLLQCLYMKKRETLRGPERTA